MYCFELKVTLFSNLGLIHVSLCLKSPNIFLLNFSNKQNIVSKFLA